MGHLYHGYVKWPEGKSMAKPQFGDGLYMFIHVHTAHVRLNRYRRLFFLWRGYHMTIKELLPHTSVDRTHYLLAMRIKHCSNAFRLPSAAWTVNPTLRIPIHPDFLEKREKKTISPQPRNSHADRNVPVFSHWDFMISTIESQSPDDLREKSVDLI